MTESSEDCPDCGDYTCNGCSGDDWTWGAQPEDCDCSCTCCCECRDGY